MNNPNSQSSSDERSEVDKIEPFIIAECFLKKQVSLKKNATVDRANEFSTASIAYDRLESILPPHVLQCGITALQWGVVHQSMQRIEPALSGMNNESTSIVQQNATYLMMLALHQAGDPIEQIRKSTSKRIDTDTAK